MRIVVPDNLLWRRKYINTYEKRIKNTKSGKQMAFWGGRTPSWIVIRITFKIQHYRWICMWLNKIAALRQVRKMPLLLGWLTLPPRCKWELLLQNKHEFSELPVHLLLLDNHSNQCTPDTMMLASTSPYPSANFEILLIRSRDSGSSASSTALCARISTRSSRAGVDVTQLECVFSITQRTWRACRRTYWVWKLLYIQLYLTATSEVYST